ncbi:hypothetical protein TELCIR_09247 [Teladorsagia circumcincta]|uniref:Uncharacterized protein n=1 Tax=Teladorsagia circumcincta TaxID=45464 RepID=A0A2G9UFD8_TELCI|nr:hypothetical protein TELCIR_09247 [Teladorsagia circumcincta]
MDCALSRVHDEKDSKKEYAMKVEKKLETRRHSKLKMEQFFSIFAKISPGSPKTCPKRLSLAQLRHHQAPQIRIHDSARWTVDPILEPHVRGKEEAALSGVKCKEELNKVLDYIDSLKYSDHVDYEFIYKSLTQAAKTCGGDINDPYDWERVTEKATASSTTNKSSTRSQKPL